MRSGVRVLGYVSGERGYIRLVRVAKPLAEVREVVEVVKAREDAGIDDKPRSVYELLTRQMLDGLREDVREVKGRVNALLWLTVGAILVDLVMRVVG